jgi:exodeoxyribonuclease V alpha subunit
MKLLGEKCPTPVMITKNNRSLEVNNGDVGVVMPKDEDSFWMTKGNGEATSLPVELLPDRETSFAITIHKSQGSEYKDVIIVLPPVAESDNAVSLMTREILYTAITRTVKQVFIFADDETIRQCCENEIQRVTGLLN